MAWPPAPLPWERFRDCPLHQRGHRSRHRITGRDLIARCPVRLRHLPQLPRALFDHCPSNARIVDTAPMSLEEVVEIVKATEAGHDIARLHSGDLSIWSALGEQLRRFLDELGIAYTVTPGVPAFAAAAAALKRGLPALPEVAQSVVLTRTPGRASAMPKETLAAYAATGATLAIHLPVRAPNRASNGGRARRLDRLPCSRTRASWPDGAFCATLGAGEEVSHDPIERTALRSWSAQC